MNIVVADDHVIFRTGLRLALEGMGAGVQVHDTPDLPSLLERLERHEPVDAVIADLHMPGMNHCTGIGRIRSARRQTPILVLSASDDPEDVYACLAAGASGYVHKSSPTEVLYQAVRTVCAGGVHLPREVISEGGRPPARASAAPSASGAQATPSSASMAQTPAWEAPSHRTAPQPFAHGPSLTPRQQQVFDLLAQGHANKRIAYDLNMSEGTVKAHVAAIMRAFGVGNRVQLLLAARRAGRLHPAPTEAKALS